MNSVGQDLWNSTLRAMETKMDKAAFQTWLAATEVQSFDGAELVIKVPSKMAHDHIHNHLLPQIQTTLSLFQSRPIKTTFTLVKPSKKHSVDGAFGGAPFNPRYLFDTFVIGDRNRLAHAASLAVSEKPGMTYNPLFLYGGVGLGKTHLMHAIAQHALEIDPARKIVYITSETFLNEFVNALQTSTIDDFRNKYRTVDILLIDDIQFISGKDSTQEEFFHTFNALHADRKQIVITSDRPPKDLIPLEDRLRSRFSGGLLIDIKPPEFETRVAILRKKAKSEAFELPDDVLMLIATKVENNVRELEGALIRVIAFSSMTNRDVSVPLAEEALQDLFSPGVKRQITLYDVQKAVCNHYHLKIDDLKSRSRQRDVTFPRQIAMYLSRELTGLSLPKIGHEFGGRDHTTVIHACEKISREIVADQGIKQIVQFLRNQLDSE